MKAIIRPTKKVGPGAVFRLAHALRGAFKSRDQTGQARADKHAREVCIDTKIPQGEFEKILSSVDIYNKVGFEVQYLPEAQQPRTCQSTFPSDYGMLKGTVKRQEQELGVAQTRISELEQDLSREQSRANSLDAQVKDLRAKYGAREVSDIHAEIMTRENSAWENFTKQYTENLQVLSELQGIPVSVLEKECLEYAGLENREDFQKIAKEFREAEEAEEIVKKHRGVKLEAYHQQILEKGRRIMERDKAIKEARDALVLYVIVKKEDGKEEAKKTRVDVRMEDGETLLTLPYKFKGQYPDVEMGLIDEVNQCLKKAEAQYKQEDFNGLLRYRISGMGTRARNKLFKMIKGCSDAFTRLGGEREIIGIGIYG